MENLKSILEKENENYESGGEVKDDVINNFDRVLEWIESEVGNNKEQVESIDAELLDKFNLDKESIINIKESLSQLGLELDINNVLQQYNTFLEDKLSNLDSGIKEKIIKSIGLRFQNIDKVLEEQKNIA